MKGARLDSTPVMHLALNGPAGVLTGCTETPVSSRHRPHYHVLLALSLFIGLAGRSEAAERTELDRAMTVPPSPVAAAALQRAMADPALLSVGRAAEFESRYALPTFLWGTPSGAATTPRRATS